MKPGIASTETFHTVPSLGISREIVELESTDTFSESPFLLDKVKVVDLFSGSRSTLIRTFSVGIACLVNVTSTFEVLKLYTVIGYVPVGV
ncbi:hypothetical protein DR78_1502 [Francisella philomiragia]|uniref:Uncharacterized protein n=1 Tax=Francisella philomiragia TaxID=28110 RepID=A0AAW3DD10_9GAMM|nr:hypothetical protein [Francisella philomiragia]KFJ43999.1 hypothetical protein DR78_1502 [Francisella philomiragia]